MKKHRPINYSLTQTITALYIWLLSPALAFANGESPVSQGLGYLTNLMFGATGIAIATLAIIGVGLLCLGHYLEWKRLLQTVAGIAIIFGARVIVTGIVSLVSTG